MRVPDYFIGFRAAFDILRPWLGGWVGPGIKTTPLIYTYISPGLRALELDPVGDI